MIAAATESIEQLTSMHGVWGCVLRMAQKNGVVLLM